MCKASVIGSWILCSFVVAISGCLFDPDAAPVDELNSSDELTTSNDEDAAAITITATPTCNWVAEYSGAWVPYFDGNPGTVDCQLAKGSSGAGVRQLQHSMNLCYSEHLVEDGQFGDKTEAALKRTQVKAVAPVDGQYNAVDRKRLRHEAVVTGPSGGGPCRNVP